MRPIGGWIFGHIADGRGRRYSLVLARMIQGLAHGGETGSALTYLAEVAPQHRRGLWASTPWLGVGLGSMMATALGAFLTSVLSNAQMVQFGWRIPFAIGALLGLYALYIRRTMAESHVYEAARSKEKGPRHTPPASQIMRSIWAERTALLRSRTHHQRCRRLVHMVHLRAKLCGRYG